MEKHRLNDTALEELRQNRMKAALAENDPSYLAEQAMKAGISVDEYKKRRQAARNDKLASGVKKAGAFARDSILAPVVDIASDAAGALTRGFNPATNSKVASSEAAGRLQDESAARARMAADRSKQIAGRDPRAEAAKDAAASAAAQAQQKASQLSGAMGAGAAALASMNTQDPTAGVQQYTQRADTQANRAYGYDLMADQQQINANFSRGEAARERQRQSNINADRYAREELQDDAEAAANASPASDPKALSDNTGGAEAMGAGASTGFDMMATSRALEEAGIPGEDVDTYIELVSPNNLKTAVAMIRSGAGKDDIIKFLESARSRKNMAESAAGGV